MISCLGVGNKVYFIVCEKYGVGVDFSTTFTCGFGVDLEFVEQNHVLKYWCFMPLGSVLPKW